VVVSSHVITTLVKSLNSSLIHLSKLESRVSSFTTPREALVSTTLWYF